MSASSLSPSPRFAGDHTTPENLQQLADAPFKQMRFFLQVGVGLDANEGQLKRFVS